MADDSRTRALQDVETATHRWIRAQDPPRLDATVTAALRSLERANEIALLAGVPPEQIGAQYRRAEDAARGYR